MADQEKTCKDASETIQHITAGCRMQEGWAYMEHHKHVAGIKYRNICVYVWPSSLSVKIGDTFKAGGE